MSKVKEALKKDLANDKKEKILENKEQIIENLEENKEILEQENEKLEEKEQVEQSEEIEKDNENTTCEKEDKQKQIDETSEMKNIDFLHKYTIAITIISVLLFIGLVVFSTVFGLVNRGSNKIVRGVSINGIEVSGLTREEAKEILIRVV